MTKSRKIRLYPTGEQRTTLRRWLGTARYVYNQTLAYKAPRQTCFIPKSAVKPRGIYYTIAGDMRYGEALPEVWLGCELSYQQGRWYLCVSFQTMVQEGENQARIVALDPGTRTFITFFAPDMAGVLGYHDFGRLVRLCHYLDDLIARRSLSKNKKQRYRIPTFETAQMAKRERRKLRAKSVRALLTWAHYAFKERLKGVAMEYGKRVVEVNEAYTSKTCSWSGEVVKVGSSEIIRGTDGVQMHRDVNGARGIFLRALAELP